MLLAAPAEEGALAPAAPRRLGLPFLELAAEEEAEEEDPAKDEAGLRLTYKFEGGTRKFSCPQKILFLPTP